MPDAIEGLEAAVVPLGQRARVGRMNQGDVCARCGERIAHANRLHGIAGSAWDLGLREIKISRNPMPPSLLAPQSRRLTITRRAAVQGHPAPRSGGRFLVLRREARGQSQPD